jgi:hypothetical protein
MKITTKFDRNDEVFVIYDNEIQQRKVSSFIVEVGTSNTITKYWLIKEGKESILVEEKRIFKKQTDLITSIKISESE